MIILFILNTLLATYTIQNDINIYHSVATSEISSTLKDQGYQVIGIRYMSDIQEVFSHFVNVSRTGWTDHDTVLLSQLLDSFNTAIVTVRKNGQKLHRHINVTEFVHLTTASSLSSLKRQIATYMHSRMKLGKAKFDPDFYYWVLFYDKKGVYDDKTNAKYDGMYKKYYCTVIKNYLR